jgi:hypothetical protein
MLSFVAASSLHAADTQLSGLHTTALVDRIVARDDGIFDETKFLPPTLPTTCTWRRRQSLQQQGLRDEYSFFQNWLTVFIMHEIGVIQSPFPQRAECPRQGTLAPHVKSLLWLHPHLSPQILNGILEYSHVWIIFQFHLNPRNKARKSNGCSNTVYYVYRLQD